MEGSSIHLPERVRKERTVVGQDREPEWLFLDRRDLNIVMRCLTAGIPSKKYVVRQFRCLG